MTAPHSVMQLVRKFGEQPQTCIAGDSGETHVRIEFVDPLFRALGWDVDNSKGLSLAHRDVVREGTILAEGDKRAPDYSFHIDGQLKFFVATRKPSVTIGADPGPAFQLRRYAWSAGLPISIITGFDEVRSSTMAGWSRRPRTARRLPGSCSSGSRNWRPSGKN